jgi:calcineurin-like phosphoesterase family protein
MSYVYLTADCHFGHANIGLYCNRLPALLKRTTEDSKFRDDTARAAYARGMNEFLIASWKNRVTKNDTVYHLGDFLYKKQPGWRSVAGVSGRCQEIEELLPGKIIHIAGNHDHNNGVKGLESAIMYVGGLKILLRHKPVEFEADLMGCDFCACGHVHEKWAYRKWGDVININVGVDVRKFMPMRMDEVVGWYHKIEKDGK